MSLRCLIVSGKVLSNGLYMLRVLRILRNPRLYLESGINRIIDTSNHMNSVRS